MDHILSIVVAFISVSIGLLLSIISSLIIGFIIEIILNKLFQIEAGTIIYKYFVYYISSFAVGLTMGLIQMYLIIKYNLYIFYFIVISLYYLYDTKINFKQSQKIYIFNNICQSNVVKFKKFLFINSCISIIIYLITIFSISYYYEELKLFLR